MYINCNCSVVVCFINEFCSLDPEAKNREKIFHKHLFREMKYNGCYRSHVNAIPEMTTEQQAVRKIRIGLETQITALLEQREKGNGTF